ncbi:MAG TPA: hypothetical protein VLE96_07280 [Chlamydiales bacterium]|nr:hypothetical protein [Chlamydiales bacterium]
MTISNQEIRHSSIPSVFSSPDRFWRTVDPDFLSPARDTAVHDTAVIAEEKKSNALPIMMMTACAALSVASFLFGFKNKEHEPMMIAGFVCGSCFAAGSAVTGYYSCLQLSPEELRLNSYSRV